MGNGVQNARPSPQASSGKSDGLIQFILLIRIIAYGGIRGIRRREVWSYYHATR